MSYTRTITVTTATQIADPLLAGLTLISGSLGTEGFRVQATLLNPDVQSATLYARYRLSSGGQYTDLTTETTTGTSQVFILTQLNSNTRYRVEVSLRANFSGSVSYTRAINITTSRELVEPTLTDIFVVAGSLGARMERGSRSASTTRTGNAGLSTGDIRNLDSGGNFIVLTSQATTGTAHSFVFSGLDNDTEYEVEISFRNDYGGDDSRTRSITFTTIREPMEPVLTGLVVVSGSLSSTGLQNGSVSRQSRRTTDQSLREASAEFRWRLYQFINVWHDRDV